MKNENERKEIIWREKSKRLMLKTSGKEGRKEGRKRGEREEVEECSSSFSSCLL